MTAPANPRHCLDVFPEIVWCVIIENLSPVDLYALSLTCTTLNDLVERRGKFKHMFSLVLPFLIWDSRPELKNSLLHCRLVSRAWARDVENYTRGVDKEYTSTVENSLLLKEIKRRSQEENILIRVGLEEMFPPPSSITALLKYKFHTVVEPMNTFLEQMTTRPVPNANPFISRRVAFAGPKTDLLWGARPPPAVTAGFWNGVTQFLTRVGEHIWYCDLDFEEGTFDTPTQLYEYLRRAATLMPGLKGFTVVYPGRPFQYEYQLNQLEALWQANPLPLQVEELNISCRTSALTRMVVRSCSRETLKVLELLESKYDRDEDIPRPQLAELGSTFPNLSMVELNIYRDSPSLFAPRSVVSSWPLAVAKLEVKLKPELGRPRLTPQMEGVSFSMLCVWLSQFGRTLRTLGLKLTGNAEYRGTVQNGDINHRLHLPILKELHMEVVTRAAVTVSSLEFARELRRLKLLRVDAGTFVTAQNTLEEQMPLFIGQGKVHVMRTSRIWRILPLLQRLALIGEDAPGRGYKSTYRYLRPSFY